MRSFISSHRRGSSAESGSHNPLNLTNIEENDKNTECTNAHNANNNNNHSSLKPSLMPATGIFLNQTSPSKLIKVNSQLQHISSSPQRTSPLKETVMLPPTKPSSGVYSSPTTPLMNNDADAFGSPNLNSTVTKNSSSKSLELNRGNFNDKSSSSPSALNLHTKSPKKSRNPIKNFLKQRVSSSNLHSMASQNPSSNSSSSPNLNYTEPQGLYTLNPHGSRNNSSPKIKQKASFSNLSSLTAPLTKKKSAAPPSIAPPSHKSNLTSSTGHWLSGGISEFTSSPTIYGTLTHNWGSDEPNKNASPRLFRNPGISQSTSSLVSSEERVHPLYLNSTDVDPSKESLSRGNNFHEINNNKKDNPNELVKINSGVSTGSQLSALSLVPETMHTTLSTSVTPIAGSMKSKTNGEFLRSTFGRKEGLVSESDLNFRGISTLSNESVGDFSIVVINKKKKNKSLKSVTISDQLEVDNFSDNTGVGLYDEDADENDNASYSSSSNFSFQENSKKGRNASIKYYKSSEQMKYDEQKLRTADYQRHMQNYIEDEGIGEDGLGEGMNYVDFDEEDETEALFNRNLFSSDEEDDDDNDNLNRIETGNSNDTEVVPELNSNNIPVEKLSEDYENFSSADFDSDEENNNESDDTNIDDEVYRVASTGMVKRIEEKELFVKSNENSDKTHEHEEDLFLDPPEESKVEPKPIPTRATETEYEDKLAPTATPTGLFPNNEIFNLLRQLESSEEVRASSISGNDNKPKDIPDEKVHIEDSTSLLSEPEEIKEIVQTDNVAAETNISILQEQNLFLNEFPKPKTPETVILQQSPVLKPKTTANESLALRSRKPSIKYHQVLSSMDSDMKFLNKRYSWFPNDESKKLNKFKNTKHFDYCHVSNTNNKNVIDSNSDVNSRMANIDEGSSNDEHTNYTSPEPHFQFVDGFDSPTSTIKNDEELLFNDIVRSVPNGESSDTASNNSSLNDKFEDSLLDEINQVPEDYEFEELESEYQNNNNARFQAPALANNRIFNNRAGSFNSMHTNSFNKSSHALRSDNFPINTRSRGSLRSFLNKSSLKTVNDPRASSLNSTSSGNRIELKDKTVTLFNTVPSRNNSFKSDFNYPGSIVSDSLDSRCNSYENKSSNGNTLNNKGNLRFQDLYNIANVNISGDIYSSNDDFTELDKFRSNSLSISTTDQTSNEDHGLTTITESGYHNKH
ncbi:hypothetical protein B5S30_g776 [[Candida] boidinii]|nr:hypothetical protein B5S30_g776 [[Candida] boidinii]GMF98391.1 unnamed protein product [[Candida] boidinii]